MAGHKLAVAAATLFLGGCATLPFGTAQAAQVCDDSPASNRRIVLAFYTEGLIGRQPRHAFERYMAPGFVEHKPDVPLGIREAAATFLEELIAEAPEPVGICCERLRKAISFSCMLGSLQRRERQHTRLQTFSASKTARSWSIGMSLPRLPRTSGPQSTLLIANVRNRAVRSPAAAAKMSWGVDVSPPAQNPFST